MAAQGAELWLLLLVYLIQDELDSEPESPAVVSDWEVLSDKDPAKDNELDQEL